MSEDRTELSEYLLGELDEQRRGRFDERLRRDPALRAEVEALRPIVTLLGELPPDAWPPPTAPVVPRARGRAVTRTRVALAAAGVAIALIAGIIGYQIHGNGASPPAGPAVVLRPLPDRPSDAHATALLTTGGRIVVTFRGLARPRPGQFYELWLMSDLTHLVSLASFNVSHTGSASLNIPVPVDPHLFTFLDVSLQAADAGPKHSGHSVLRGRIVS